MFSMCLPDSSSETPAIHISTETGQEGNWKEVHKATNALGILATDSAHALNVTNCSSKLYLAFKLKVTEVPTEASFFLISKLEMPSPLDYQLMALWKTILQDRKSNAVMFTIGGEFSHLRGLYAQNFCTLSKTMIKEQCIFHWKGSISQIHGCWKKFQAQISALDEQLKKNTYVQTPLPVNI